MKESFSIRNLIIYAVLFLLFSLLISFNFFYYLNASISDRIYSGKSSLDNIVILKIDDESIGKIGRWPWNRDVFADVLSKLNEAKVIGVDVSFFEESDSDENLKSFLESSKNTILASEINEGVLIKPIFDSEHGYVNLATDSDGVTRSVDSGIISNELPFSFQIYKKYSGKEILENKNYLINFAGSPGTFNSISIYDVLSREDFFDFKNKIVLIGATAPNLHDLFYVPTSEGVAMYGVEIHANIIQNLILNNFLEKQKKYSIILLVFLSSVICYFFLSKLKIYYIIPVVLLFLFSYFIASIFLFNNYNYLIDLFFFPVSVLFFTGAGIAANYLEEKKQNIYLTNAFGKYISKDLLKEILEKKHQMKLGGAKRQITIFFSDIRGFTSISEKLSPEDLVGLMNDYLTKMTEIILKNNGTVDKFIGDAIMAFWNAPLLEENHSKLACKSAIEQIDALNCLKKEWNKKGHPEIKIGCGINTGDAIIGNMGSEDRFDYTAIGDSVNLASRLEGLTKQYGVDIIISDSTKNLIEGEFTTRKLDLVKVKGKKIPVAIYELCAKPDKELIKKYEKALTLYFKSNFKDAKKEFEDILKISPDDCPSKIFVKRCGEYIKNPPKKEWDGVFELMTK
ncbi:MAG: CHASE2 domain-containing protein [archaeon]